MAKYKVRIYETIQHGSRVVQGRQVKQKTFEADSFDDAEQVARRIWAESAGDTGMTLTRVDRIESQRA